jgi:glycopeptide antibiotics resistance protein
MALAALTIAIALVVAADYPWGDMVGHTHWGRVDWIPFITRPLRASDLAANVLLCAPIGVVLGLWYRRATLLAVVITFPLVFVLESTQLYSHLRFPSSTDIVCNVAGAAASAALAGRYRNLILRRIPRYGDVDRP